MKKLEYKFLTLPKVSIKSSFLNKDKCINNIRIAKLDYSFNELARDGWILVEIYWMEGLALFKKEID